MSNTFHTPQTIAGVAARLVGGDLSLAGLVHRDLEAGFGAGLGATVRVRVPGAVEAHTKGVGDKSTPLVNDELTEQAIDVTLSTHAYSKVLLSEKDFDLDIADFGSQVLRPQTSAIVKHVERAVAAAMQATPETTAITFDEANPARAFTAIRAKLRTNGVSTDEPLLAAVGSDVYGALLDGPTGSAGTTFDESGKVRGFSVVESTRLAPDEILGFVRPAFALVVRAPAVPAGAPYGASVNEGGFALRHIRAYETDVAADASLVSAYVGVKAMPLAVDNEDGTVSLVANGGAVRVLTSA